MFRTSICPSSGFQVVYCCMWCSALATRTLCSFLPLTFPNPLHDHASRIQTHTQCTTKLHTSSLGPQPPHLGKYHLFSINTCTHSPATHTPTPPSIKPLIHHPLPTPTLDTHKHYNKHTLHVPAHRCIFHPLQ